MPRPADSAQSAHPEYAGQYRLESVLGSGGMGVVQLATSASGLRLAVKVVHAEFAADPEFRARFRQEVAAARRVSGAFTAAVVDADPDSERPWMATLFVEGPTLAEQVKRKPLDTVELSRLGAGLAEALRDIHRAGVVHRDLKPSNVLMAADGPKVIDFGISRPYDSDLRTETGKLIGTPPFMAPEQFQRPREVGPEADVFAMGAVLVHAATGRGPFDSDSPYLVAYQVVHHEPDLTGVPAELAPLIARCLEKDPKDRPTTDALLAALRSAAYPTSEDTRAFIPAPRQPRTDEVSTHRRARIDTASAEPQGAEEPAKREGSAQPVRRRVRAWSGRSRWPAVVGAGVLLAGAGVAAYVFGGAGGADRTDDRPGSRPVGGVAAAPGVLAPWSVRLGQGGGMPVCSAAGDGALYCKGPGVGAARLAQADGSVRWSVKATDGGTRVSEDRAPVPAGGLVHTVAADGRRLEARDPDTGAVRWSERLPVSASLVHAGAGRATVLVSAPDGQVTALDSATGRRLWSKRVGGVGAALVAGADAGATSGAGAASGAASRAGAGAASGAGDGAGAGRGLVFVATPTADGASTSVVAVVAESGAVRWRLRVDGQLAPAGSTAGALFLLRSDRFSLTDAVVRIDLATRSVRRLVLGSPVDQAQAAVGADGTVYLIGFAGGLTAVQTADASKPAERWRLETLVSRVSRPAPAGDRVYLSAADGRVLAVHAGTGRLLGQTEPRRGGDTGLLAPTLPAPLPVAGGRVFASAPDGSVFAADGRDPAAW
ncbi:protein kinase domain-containing protein [Streptomyces sp. NPDC002073]